MASQSGTPSTAAENAQNLGRERPHKEVQLYGKAEGDKRIALTPLLENPESMREEQVQNAVMFLSHPKVRGAPIISRRSFLEKKGLTKEEIDEAFRRVLDPPPAAVASNASQDGQVKSPSNNQLLAPTQTLRPSANAPATVVSSLGTLKRSKLHWSHVILAVGLLSISGVGTTLMIKNKILPRLKSWMRKVVKDGDEALVKRESSRTSLEEEAAAAAKAAAEAAAEVAKANQEMLNSKYEERKKLDEIFGLLNMQLQELKSLTSAILSLEGDLKRTNFSGRASVAEGRHQVNVTIPNLYENREMDYDFNAVKSSSPQTLVKSSTVPHPNAYMEGGERNYVTDLQRGEEPSYYRCPWGVSQVPSNSNSIHESQTQSEFFYSMLLNELNHQKNSDNSASWWQQYKARIPGNVPEQATQVLMPKAAEAIQRSKSIVQTKTLANNQLVTPPDMASEVQGITENGSAGEVGLLGEVLGPIQHSSEVQEE